MRRISKFFLFIMIMGALSIFSFAAAPWELIRHSLGDVNELEKEMDKMVAKGYEPIGLEVMESGPQSGVYIMYILSDQQDYIDYKIEFYAGADQRIEDDITAELEKGYTPLDISSIEEGVYILYVEYKNHAVTEWAYEETKPELEDVGNLLIRYGKKDPEFMPVGITAWEHPKNPSKDFYSVFFIKIPGLNLKDYDVFSYKGFDEFEKGVDALVNEGWSLGGFAIYGDDWDIVVVK